MGLAEHCVRSFIAAHFAWEVRANERARPLPLASAEYRAAVVLAESEYEDLVSRLCAASVVRQNISFGDDPTHDPDREFVESVSESGGGAVVRTRQVGRHDFVSEYEYHLVLEESGWRIASVLYLDQGRKYECL